MGVSRLPPLTIPRCTPAASRHRRRPHDIASSTAQFAWVGSRIQKAGIGCQGGPSREIQPTADQCFSGAEQSRSKTQISHHSQGLWMSTRHRSAPTQRAQSGVTTNVSGSRASSGRRSKYAKTTAKNKEKERKKRCLLLRLLVEAETACTTHNGWRVCSLQRVVNGNPRDSVFLIHHLPPATLALPPRDLQQSDDCESESDAAISQCLLSKARDHAHFLPE